MTVAVRVSPQHTLTLAPVILDAGVDILVIQGTIVSAEHVSTNDEPLNLKEFIADLDLPVVVGGCTDYKTALHLMRTGRGRRDRRRRRRRMVHNGHRCWASGCRWRPRSPTPPRRAATTSTRPAVGTCT